MHQHPPGINNPFYRAIREEIQTAMGRNDQQTVMKHVIRAATLFAEGNLSFAEFEHLIHNNDPKLDYVYSQENPYKRPRSNRLTTREFLIGPDGMNTIGINQKLFYSKYILDGLVEEMRSLNEKMNGGRSIER